MDIITVLGYFLLLVILVRLGFAFIGGVLFPFVLAPVFGLTKNLQILGGGKWAVVTGATDGIGQSYAKELAKKGFNIVLVSRTQEKLHATAKEIREKFPIEVKTVVFNFNEASTEAYGRTFGSLEKEIDVGVLVNNVGISFEYPEVFHDIPGGDDAARNMTVVNCLSVTMISKLFLPQMVSRNKGIIVNVASASAFNPTPYLGLYSATKVFVDYFTQSLQLEYQNTGLTFQCVLPFFVKTKMSGLRRATFFAPESDDFVKSAIKTIGVVGSTTGCLAHALQRAFMKFLPTVLMNKHMTNLMKSARARALRIKKKREAGEQAQQD